MRHAKHTSAIILPFPTPGPIDGVLLDGRPITRCRAEPHHAWSHVSPQLVDHSMRTGRRLILDDGRRADEVALDVTIRGRSILLLALVWHLDGVDLLIGRQGCGGRPPAPREPWEDRPLGIVVRFPTPTRWQTRKRAKRPATR